MVKIYWNNNSLYNTNIDASDVLDYIRQRLNLEVLYVEGYNADSYYFLNHNEWISDKILNCLFEYCTYKGSCNENFTFVNNEKDSDITITGTTPHSFGLKNNINDRFFDWGIESIYPIPYLKGTYLREGGAKLCSDNNRENLLSYIGGSWRGNRKDALNSLTKLKDRLISNSYEKLFYSPLVSHSHQEEGKLGWANGSFFKAGLTTYSKSVFSWQPGGDTCTRGAFYDSLMMGCIPVISKTCFDGIYHKLAVGNEVVRDMTVVVDDKLMYSGENLVEYLLNINEEEVHNKQRAIDLNCYRMQWNFNCPDNAFVDVIKKTAML